MGERDWLNSIMFINNLSPASKSLNGAAVEESKEDGGGGGGRCIQPKG
jgi:hypothetical protein